MSGLIAVTGSTGQLGGRVAQRLADRGVAQRLVVRDQGRAPRLPAAEVVVASYDQPAALRMAFNRVSTLFLVSANDAPDLLPIHAGVVDAAVDAGVSRIIYVSYLAAAPRSTYTFARDHWQTEQYIKSTGRIFTFLRNSIYQDLVPYFVGEDGVIRAPAGDGRVAAVTRDDIADVAVEVLTGSGHDDVSYDVTGPVAFTMAEAAEELTRATGRPVTYHSEDLAEAVASRSVYGAPAWELAAWVTSYAAIANGDLNVVTDTVERLAGHPPMALASYLATAVEPALG